MTQPREKRVVTPKVEWITAAAQALPDNDVAAATIRATITVMDRLRDSAGAPIISGPDWSRLVNQGGNQSLGDALGDHGYHLTKDRKGRYGKPPGGFTRALCEACFRCPPGYAWQPDHSAEWAEAAAKALAERPVISKRSAPARRPKVAPHAANQAVLAEAQELRRVALLDALEGVRALQLEFPEHQGLQSLLARLEAAPAGINQKLNLAIQSTESALAAARQELETARAEAAAAEGAITVPPEALGQRAGDPPLPAPDTEPESTAEPAPTAEDAEYAAGLAERDDLLIALGLTPDPLQTLGKEIKALEKEERRLNKEVKSAERHLEEVRRENGPADLEHHCISKIETAQECRSQTLKALYNAREERSHREQERLSAETRRRARDAERAARRAADPPQDLLTLLSDPADEDVQAPAESIPTDRRDRLR
jgi:hypothetical protein